MEKPPTRHSMNHLLKERWRSIRNLIDGPSLLTGAMTPASDGVDWVVGLEDLQLYHWLAPVLHQCSRDALGIQHNSWSNCSFLVGIESFSQRRKEKKESVAFLYLCLVAG